MSEPMSVEDELVETKHLGAQSFWEFTQLPYELRELVYSRMRIEERWSMNRARREAADFFNKKRILVDEVEVFAHKKFDGHPVIEVSYGDYNEVFSTDVDRFPGLSKEFEGYMGCSCSECTRPASRLDLSGEYLQMSHNTRVFHNASSEEIFRTLKTLVSPKNITIRSSAYGGLIESLQPFGTLPHSANMTVHLHTRGNLYHMMLYSKIEDAKWKRWFDFARVKRASFHCDPINDQQLFSKLIDLLTTSNIGNVQLCGFRSVDASKLLQLNCERLRFSKGTLIDEEFKQFCRAKMHLWLLDPNYTFYGMEVPHEYKEHGPDVGEFEGIGRMLSFYHNFHPFRKLVLDDELWLDGDAGNGACGTFRNMQSQSVFTVLKKGVLMCPESAITVKREWPAETDGNRRQL